MTSDALLRLAVAALGGAAIGLERQWSGHASGPAARFAGVRTFTMIGAVAGLSGWLWTTGTTAPAVLMLAGVVSLIVAAYVRASVRDPDATTEVAAFIAATAGVVAGIGEVRLASSLIAVTVLLLVEKSRLHAWAARLDEPGMRAAARFAVMAVVILPLLPEGPYGPFGGVRPRMLWALVLFFSGLSFAGYIARRLVGVQRGYPVAGLLGGLVSSTNVTLTFARLSREPDAPQLALAAGALGASTVLFVRVLVACLVLNTELGVVMAPVLLAGFAAGLATVLTAVRSASREPAVAEPPPNPLEFGAALQMAALFQLVLFVIHEVRTAYGAAGLLVTGAVLGLTDVDALTLSMTSEAAVADSRTVAAQALTIGIISNTLVKLAIASAIGDGRFRWTTAGGLAVMVGALGVAGALLLR